MRRFFTLALLVALGCGDDTLGPVQTIDGQWTGIQNGYSMSLIVQQTGTDVTGIADLGSVGGFVQGEVTGTFIYPAVDLQIAVPNVAATITYRGTMSSTEAVIKAKLNGAGFQDLELNLKKK